MAVPILKQSKYLIATIQSVLTDADLVQLRDALVDRVGKFRSRGVIVDVTSLDVLDSFASRTLRDLAYMIRLRGAETVIVGIQPKSHSRWCNWGSHWRTLPPPSISRRVLPT